MKFILDYSNWRSGANGEYAVGEGDTFLLNSQGYMCCLGQFTKQLNPEANILDVLLPSSSLFLEKNSFVDYDSKEGDCYDYSDLSSLLTTINDNPKTTPEEKIVKIREELEKYGHELEVINGPTNLSTVCVASC